MTTSEEFELHITDIANGGQGIGRHAGKTIFVPYTLPGETITARITEDKGRFAFAQGLLLLDPSEDRVLPQCRHFGANRCGECQWQHIDYPAQLALKTDIVLDQLSRIGGFEDVPFELTLPSPKVWGYRHEATFYPIGSELGFHSTEPDTIFPIEECHIVTPDLLALRFLLDIDLPTLTHITLRDNGAGDLMVVLGTSDDQPPELEMDIGASVNFLLSDNEPANLIGATHLRYNLLGRSYRVTAGSFLRSNPPQIETLLKLVKDWLNLQGDEAILDLYGGVGLFSGTLAPYARLITCIDSYPPAMTDAEDNLEDFDNVNILEGNVEDILVNLPDDERYDIAIIDPSTQGLSKEAIDTLEEILPARLLYISSDPATLARDAKRLQERYHYRLDKIQPIDFEPHTFRVVTLAQLSRG